MEELKKNWKLWKPVKKNEVNSYFTCPTCKLSTPFHPDYISSGIAGCTRKKCGGNIELLCKSMIEFRGGTFQKVKGDKTSDCIAYFNCGIHDTNLIFLSLKLGGNCKICGRPEQSKKKPPQESYSLRQPDCNCKKLGLGYQTGPSFICEHYNFAVIFPRQASEWDYTYNDTTPNLVAPASMKEFRFVCSKKECGEFFDQSPHRRGIQNIGCPYCAGMKISFKTSMASTHPELFDEYDHENNDKKFHEITHGSDKKVSWICEKHQDEDGEDSCFRWMARPCHRTLALNGCPRCNLVGYNQLVGGHEFFVKRASEIHDDKYTYPEEYKGANVRIKIKCPIEGHGEFPQTPSNHMRHGCPACAAIATESINLKRIKDILRELNIDFECEVSFSDLRDKKLLRIDIYIKKRHLVIEYDGQFHFELNNWNSIEQLASSKKRDIMKDLFCLRNGIHIWRIPYTNEISKEIIKEKLKTFTSEKLIYLSYQDYYEEVSDYFDMSTVSFEAVEMPEFHDYR